MKFHLKENGEPGLCSAKTRPCPYGASEDHFDSPEEARASFENTMTTQKLRGIKRKVMGVTIPENFYHVTYKRGLSNIQEHGLLPTIGERSEDMNEDAPRVYLFDSRESLTDALGNWLGEEFDEDEELVLFSIPGSLVKKPIPYFTGEETSWEWSTESVIDPSMLTLEPDEL